MAEQYKTGGDCDAWCTKCKMDLAHTIVAMVTGKPVQVKCNTCGGFHKYRAPQNTKASASPGKAKAPKAQTAAAKAKATRAEKLVIAAADDAHDRWTVAMETAGDAQQKAYNVKSVYGLGDVIAHPTFGPGVVLEVVAYNRIRTVFSRAERTLIMAHGMAPPTGD
jgi:hypothetical protein